MMSFLQDYNFPSPTSAHKFEEMCADLFTEVWKLTGGMLNGRSGQRQHGVDGYGYDSDGRIVGYQSKSVTSPQPKKITIASIKKEVLLAREFRPALHEFYFLSAAESDARLQEQVRLLTEQYRSDGRFAIHVLGWSEIKRRLGDSPQLIRKYYPEFVASHTSHEPLAISSFLQAEYVAEKITDELLLQVEVIRKSRFFFDYDAVTEARNLASKIQSGAFRYAASNARGLALSLCARLIHRDDLVYAKSLVQEASILNSDAANVVSGIVNTTEEESAVIIAKLLHKRDPEALASAFVVKSFESEDSDPVEWFAEAGYKISDLSSDGKAQYINALLRKRRWSDVQKVIAELTEEDYDKTPVLLYHTAFGHLTAAINDELIEFVTVALPLNLDSFPLLSNGVGLTARDKAITFFKRTEEVARSLRLTGLEHVASDRHLWLRLRSIEHAEAARSELERSLRDEDQSLRRINFALHFDIPLDRDAINTRIKNYQARFGIDSPVAAFAIFCLALDENDPESVLLQIQMHATVLNKLIGELELARVQFIMLVQAHRYDEAEQAFEQLKTMGLSDIQQLRLTAMIDEGRGQDPVLTRLTVFNSTGSVTDLQKLVDALYDRDDWVRLVDYGRRLFHATGSVRSLEVYCDGLFSISDDDSLYSVLDTGSEYIPQSKKLQLHWCWLLYRFGRFTECRSALERYRTNFSARDVRHLDISLHVALGQWPSLTAILDREFANENLREPSELLYLVQIAQAIDSGSSRVKEFVRRAVNNAADDAHIYLAAHSIAIKADWESDEVSSWLAKAMELSGEEGPVRRVSLREIIDWQTGWSEVRGMIHKEVARGNMPMYLAGHLMNQSLVNTLLLPLFTNPDQDDVRRRSPLFTSSSVARSPITTSSAVFDISTMFLLAKVEVLDASFELFDKVVLPHETLTWLFEQKAKFHQPSRVRIARGVMKLLSEGRISTLNVVPVADVQLVAEVGIDLAGLVTTAASKTDKQGLVVRSFPVHRAGTIMDEVANLDAYPGILCSLTTLVESLWAKAHLTNEEHTRALTYLNLEDKRWPSEPVIQDGAMLFLDNVSISYLGHLGLIEKIVRAGYSVVISQSAHAEAMGLIQYADYASASDQLIERIQDSVSGQIKKGKVHFVRQKSTQQFEVDEQKIGQHPTAGILDFVGIVDMIVVDDRSINRHSFAHDEQGRRAEIISTWEILVALHESNQISLTELFSKRTELRVMGLIHLPVDIRELNTYLQSARVDNEQVVETNELKSWRQSIMLSRISDVSLFPAEIEWLQTLTQSVVRLIGEQWSISDDLTVKRARATWLWHLLDLHDGFQIQVTKDVSQPIQSLKASMIVSLLFLNDGFDSSVHQAYKDWLDDVLHLIQEEEPSLYLQVLEIVRHEFVKIGDSTSLDKSLA